MPNPSVKLRTAVKAVKAPEDAHTIARSVALSKGGGSARASTLHRASLEGKGAMFERDIRSRVEPSLRRALRDLHLSGAKLAVAGYGIHEMRKHHAAAELSPSRVTGVIRLSFSSLPPNVPDLLIGFVDADGDITFSESARTEHGDLLKISEELKEHLISIHEAQRPASPTLEKLVQELEDLDIICQDIARQAREAEFSAAGPGGTEFTGTSAEAQKKRSDVQEAILEQLARTKDHAAKLKNNMVVLADLSITGRPKYQSVLQFMETVFGHIKGWKEQLEQALTMFTTRSARYQLKEVPLDTWYEKERPAQDRKQEMLDEEGIEPPLMGGRKPRTSQVDDVVAPEDADLYGALGMLAAVNSDMDEILQASDALVIDLGTAELMPEEAMFSPSSESSPDLYVASERYRVSNERSPDIARDAWWLKARAGLDDPAIVQSIRKLSADYTSAELPLVVAHASLLDRGEASGVLIDIWGSMTGKYKAARQSLQKVAGPSWAVDKDIWDKAEAQAKKGNYSKENGQFYRVTTKIYKNMGGRVGKGKSKKKKKSSELDDFYESNPDQIAATLKKPIRCDFCAEVIPAGKVMGLKRIETTRGQKIDLYGGGPCRAKEGYERDEHSHMLDPSKDDIGSIISVDARKEPGEDAPAPFPAPGASHQYENLHGVYKFKEARERLIKLAKKKARSTRCRKRYVNPDGTFKGGFDGCMAYQKCVHPDYSDERCRKICAAINRRKKAQAYVKEANEKLIKLAKKKSRSTRYRERYVNPDGTFKGGFDGCVAYQKHVHPGYSEERCRRICGAIRWRKEAQARIKEANKARQVEDGCQPKEHQAARMGLVGGVAAKNLRDRRKEQEVKVRGAGNAVCTNCGQRMPASKAGPGNRCPLCGGSLRPAKEASLSKAARGTMKIERARGSTPYRFRCSKCGYTVSASGERALPLRCPNCGAKLDFSPGTFDAKAPLTEQ